MIAPNEFFTPVSTDLTERVIRINNDAFCVGGANDVVLIDRSMQYVEFTLQQATLSIATAGAPGPWQQTMVQVLRLVFIHVLRSLWIPDAPGKVFVAATVLPGV